MIKIERTDIYGWEPAIRGARNPMNSWDRSDTTYNEDGTPNIGPNDLSLLHRLSVSGSDHGKFLRMITVAADITAPRYWWAEYDTYKVGTVANSCSTMHKIHAKEFVMEDFSHEHMTSKSKAALRNVINVLNLYREQYNRLKNKRDFMQMIQLLPSSYNQLRTVTLNYEVLKRIYFARRNHKLDCWHTMCDWIKELPYFKEIVLEGEADD